MDLVMMFSPPDADLKLAGPMRLCLGGRTVIRDNGVTRTILRSVSNLLIRPKTIMFQTFRFFGVLFISVGWPIAVAWGAEPAIDFAHDVVPILNRHCVTCHGGRESKGGFSLNTRGLLLEAEVIDLAAPDASELLQRVRSADAEEQMPPQDRPRVPADEVEMLRRWIQAGLPWEAGFTFAADRYEPPLSPRRPDLPPAIDGRQHPLDRLLDNYLAQDEIPRPPALEDGLFLRRVSFDLIGLPPTPEQLTEFLRDTSLDKRAKYIDRLLADREAYAAHWMTMWNDLLRNAYSGTGYIDGGRRPITGWLYRSLYQNVPFDQFVRELIAPTLEASGFIQGIKWRGNVNASQRREVQFAQSVSQAFLGINMKCASCHDSFIDRWTLAETYGLSAVYSTEPLELHRCDKPLGQLAKAAWIFPELGQIDPLAPQPARLRQLAALMTHPQNGRMSRTIVNRLWDRLMGHGIVHPVDAMHTRPWSEDVLDFLAVYLADHNYDVQQVLHLIATSSAYQSQAIQLTEVPTGDSFVFRGPIAKRLSAEQFLDAIWSMTGTWPAPRPEFFKRDGRQQFGQMKDVLATFDSTVERSNRNPEELMNLWGNRPVRAVFLDLDPLQANLGRPIREQVVSARPSELTTLQAIQLTNGTELTMVVSRAAERLLQQPDLSADRLIEQVYQAALSRNPTSDEQTLARQILAGTPDGTSESARVSLDPSRVEDFLWMIWMLPEFQLIL
jgi:hypothetical protein